MLLPWLDRYVLLSASGTATASRSTSRIRCSEIQRWSTDAVRRALTIQLLALHNATLCRVDEEHVAGRRRPFAERSRWAPESAASDKNHEVVVGDDVATGTESIWIEHGADAPPIGERYRGRSIPSLHRRRMNSKNARRSGDIVSSPSHASGMTSSSHAAATFLRAPEAPAHCRATQSHSGRRR